MIAAVERASIAITIGGMTVIVRVSDASFLSVLEKRYEGWMRQRAVQRAAPMETVEAHRRPSAEPDVAACRHVGRIGG